jgi:hypothetical protein
MRQLLILILLLSSSFPSVACAFGKKRTVALDPVTSSSVLDGDATGLAEIAGCPSGVGFAYCREAEGAAADRSIAFIGPPAQCDREACVFVKVFDNQGRLVWGGSIPKGQTRVSVPWATLLGSPTFEFNYRGFWSFTTTVYFVGPDKRERETVSLGDIVLRVFRKGYAPLQGVADDPAFVWHWAEADRAYKATAGLRAWAGVVQ